MAGFSLREVARRSGVSPAAPAHHFGDAAGLLAAVAMLAWNGLTAALEAGNVRGGADPVKRLREQGVGYVDFAFRHPGRFGVMFRCEAEESEALQRSSHAAYLVLENGVRDLYGVPADAPLAPAQWHALLSIWSVVHGYANLALSGQFNAVAPPNEREARLRMTLGAMLDQQIEALRRSASDVLPPAGA